MCLIALGDEWSVARQQRPTLGPAGGGIDHRQRLYERAASDAAMCHHIDPTKAWRRAIPIVERADRNLASDCSKVGIMILSRLPQTRSDASHSAVNASLIVAPYERLRSRDASASSAGTV